MYCQTERKNGFRQGVLVEWKKNKLGKCILPFGISLIIGWQKLWLHHLPYAEYERVLSGVKRVD